MNRKLTNEEEAKLSSYMRVIEFVRKNEQKVKKVPGFMDEYKKLKEALRGIINELDEEELNIVLKRYKNELAYLREQHKDINL